jgi:dTDP-4-amino-4,6-dideoxygalactose transaminase
VSNSHFSSWPSYSIEEADAVKSVLLSNNVNYWTGSHCKKFELEFSEWLGVNYSIAMANGSVALDAAMKALDIGPGDEVIVTPRSFIASVSCVVNAGAKPIFADVDLKSGNITAKSINKVISESTKAVICVHLAGWPCDMDPIISLAKKHQIFVVEDCSQAHGASYKGKNVGTIGDIGTWSFCQDKIMTTGGEGGMVTTNDHSLWDKMWSYKDHGKNYDVINKTKDLSGFKWVHQSFGTNLRMTEIQAVIGRIQLKKMKDWTKKRNTNAQRILQVCSLYPSLYRVEFPPTTIVHAWYKCYVYLHLDGLKDSWDKSNFTEYFNNNDIPCYSGSCSEIYMEKAFDGTMYRPKKRLNNAKQLGESSLMFLVHPTISDQELNKTCNLIMKISSKIGK